MEFLRQLWGGIADAWRRLSLSARVNIALASLATVVVVGALVFMGSRPQYVSLFPDIELASKDTDQIQQILASDNIPYELGSRGKEVLVPLQYHSDVLVKLSTQGIPESDSTSAAFSLFDSPNIMRTRFDEQVNYQRAIMASLQKTLTVFDFVDQAHVFIREAPEEFFTAAQKPSKATVTLKLNRAVSKTETKAVLNVVTTYGGAYLNPENVTITTTEGKLLHAPAQDGFDYIANSRQEHHLAWEKEREQAAQDALLAMQRQSVVQVAMEFDFSTKEEVSETVGEGQPISSMTTTTSLTSAESLPEGPTGALQNLPPGTAAPSTQTEETREETYENFEIPHTTTRTTEAPGRIIDARVTAIVEGTYQPKLDENGEPTGENTYVSPTDEEMDSFRSLVANAVGFGVTAEDVEIYDQPFQLDTLTAGMAPGAPALTQAFTQNLVQYGLKRGPQILVLIVAFFVLRALLMRSFTPPPEEEEVVIDVPQASIEERRRREIAAEVERLSKDEPETVASLLRSWLSESEE